MHPCTDVCMWAHICMRACTHTHTIHIYICIHARMYVCMWTCGARVDTHACRHAHTIHIYICIHTRMYVCGHVVHVWTHMHTDMHTQSIYTQSMCGYVSMVRCGWVANHACGHVCTCARGVLMVPVSDFLCRCLARTHLGVYSPLCLGFLYRCLCLGAPHARGMHHAWGGVPAGVVPYVLWIGGSCMHVRRACVPHAHTRRMRTCTYLWRHKSYSSWNFCQPV